MNAPTYIGTKLLKARPITRGGYNAYRGWETPADENPDDEGYIVEYLDGGEPNHPKHDGYISWTPKSVFRKSYRAITNMTFGQALEALKIGKKVTRTGWNGKGMYLYHVGPGRYPPSTPAGLEIAANEVDNRVPYDPYIAMKTVGDTVVPWLCSQTDMLAEDWMIKE